MAESLTLEEVKQKKIELELSVVKIFKEFEESTSLKLGYVDILRKRIKRKKGEEEDFDRSCGPGGYRNGPIKDVNINVDLDLVY